MKYKFKYITIFIFILLLIFTPGTNAGNPDILKNIDVRIDIVWNGKVTLESINGFMIKDEFGKIIKSSDTFIEINKINNNYGLVRINGKNINFDLKGNSMVTNINGEKFPIKVNGHSYRGGIKLINKNNSIYIINSLDIDDYLKGVLPRETYASSGPMELLKSQALASRSFLESNRNKHSSEGYNLCNTTHCQVYGGYDSEHPRTNLAVEETKGEYVVYEGTVANTVYHSSSGGYTESAKDVWSGDIPYLKAVEDPFSAYGRNSSWEYEINPRELSQKLSSRGIFIGDIRGVRIDETSKSSRVKQISIIGSKSNETMTGNQFRTLLGTMNLKSTLFSLVPSEDLNSPELDLASYYVLDKNEKISKLSKNMTYIDENGNLHAIKVGDSILDGHGKINTILKEYKEGESDKSKVGLKLYGKGFGHGVGMSQQGAREMAEKGYTYEDIIKYYYKDIEIIKY